MIEINAIKIKDPDKWVVAKLPDFLVQNTLPARFGS